MINRNIYRTASLLLGLMLVCMVREAAAENHPASAGNSETGRRPNILFILTDDQAPFSLGAYGNTICNTPNIDRIARQGIRLDNAYHMGGFLGAVCTTSRHMIMTGRTLWHLPRAKSREEVLASQDRSGLAGKTFRNANIPDQLEESSLAAVFNRGGYDTMRTCKRGNSYPAANQKFRTVHDATKRQSRDEAGSAWHADRVLEYLDARKKSGTEKPFLVYFGLSHPHDPRWADEKLLARYGAVNQLELPAQPNPKSPPLPINYLPAHPFHHGHRGLRDEVSVQGVMENRDEVTIRNEKGREYACIENIDQQVGRVLEKLEQMGELDNTYVFFTADHGIAIGRHGLMGKQSLYEHSWRVPFLAMGPGIRPGSTAKGNIYLLDVLATLCDLAGVEVPATNEGKSMKPVLLGKVGSLRDVLYGCYCGGTKPGMRSVRKGDWKLIKYETLDGQVKETQLFHLAENPHELLREHHDEKVVKLTGNRPRPNQVNLAELPEFREKRKEMEALLLAEMVRLNDPYRFDEGFVNPPRPARQKNRNRNKKKNQ
ncbi:MAG: sulfatase-like hydrolase/transferase [Planctomycetota bacterium]|nr:sulfatase-like hydrolase/transferase [Planctomycetota bacterium]